MSAWPPHQPCPASQKGSEPGGFGFTGPAPARAAWAWWGDASLRPPTGSRGKATCAQGLRCLYGGPPAVQTLSKEAPLLGSFPGCTAVGVHGLLALPVMLSLSGAALGLCGVCSQARSCLDQAPPLHGEPRWGAGLAKAAWSPLSSSLQCTPRALGARRGATEARPSRGRRDHSEGESAEDQPGRGTYTGNGTDRIPQCHTGTPFLWPGPPCPCRPAD